MFNFISRFITTPRTEIENLAEEIRWVFISVLTLTIVGVAPSFLGAPIAHSFYLSFLIWIFSAYRLFGIWRYLRTAIAGEVIDAFQAIGPETNETIWDSKVAATYRKIAVNIWLAQTLIFLIAPLYFNFTSGGRLWLPIIIMIIFAIAMISTTAFMWIFRTIAVVTIIIFSMTAIYDMFPHINTLPFISEGVAKLKAGKEAGENARTLATIDELREKQRQANLNSVLTEVADWQIANSGKKLPSEILDKIEVTKKGISLEEYKEQIKAKNEAEARAINQKTAEKNSAELKKTKEDMANFLPDGTIKVMFHNNHDWAKNILIYPGEYEVSPKEKNFKIATEESDWQYKTFKNSFVIPDNNGGDSQYIAFHSNEPTTFFIKKKEESK